MKRIILCVLAATVSWGAVGRAQVIDRILAVVDRALITQSDVLGAMRLGLVRERSVATALDRLIERQLVLTEVDRYAPPEPRDADVDRKVAELRERATSPAAFDKTLAEIGMTLEQISRHVRDDLRIEAYLQQRFGSPVQPSEDEVLQYFRDHEAQFAHGGTVPPYAEVRDAARAALVAERRMATIADWIAGLRRRTNVNILLTLPGGAGASDR